MPDQTRITSPGPDAASVRLPDGRVVRPPADWTLVPPGDPGLTRRLKAAGPTWTVQEKRGRKIFSRGVWTSAATVETVRAQLAAERATPQYAKRQLAAAQRRDEDQAVYVADFYASVLTYLNFHPAFTTLAQRLAKAVTEHATPVGSGTVARTERITIEERAEAAIIAWMRHQTTAYDSMAIARIKGKRREVRRMLAMRSKQLLSVYRAGTGVDAERCPLQRALSAA